MSLWVSVGILGDASFHHIVAECMPLVPGASTANSVLIAPAARTVCLTISGCLIKSFCCLGILLWALIGII